MLKYVSLALVLLLFIEVPIMGVVPPETLTGKEVVWSGEVELQHDVTIPEGTILTILPGTNIHCIYKYGEGSFSPEKWQIRIKGKLVAAGGVGAPITFDPLPYGLSSLRIPLNPKLENISIAPQAVKVEDIKNEFSAFRTQYLVLWSLLFGSIYYAIKTR